MDGLPDCCLPTICPQEIAPSRNRIKGRLAALVASGDPGHGSSAWLFGPYAKGFAFGAANGIQEVTLPVSVSAVLLGGVGKWITGKAYTEAS